MSWPATNQDRELVALLNQSCSSQQLSAIFCYSEDLFVIAIIKCSLAQERNGHGTYPTLDILRQW